MTGAATGGAASAPAGDTASAPAGDRRPGRRLWTLGGAAFVVLVLLVTVFALVREPGPSTAAAATPPATTTASSAPAGDPNSTWAPTTPNPQQSAAPQDVAGLRPVTVSIPSIDVQSDLLPLAVDGTGVLVPPDPYDIAGWFTGGPVPGELGPAIIAGHVDSRAGPGVFFRLEEMRPGQRIEVTRSDGSVATFVVNRVERYPKTAFPTAQVYGPTPAHELRLITCGGDFDRSRRSYVDNIVVYAVLDGGIT